MHHINLFDCIFLFTLFTWVVHCYMIWLYMHLYIHSYFNIITCLYMYLIAIFDGNFIFTLFAGVLHCSMIWLYIHLYIHSYFCVIGIWSLATLVDMWHSTIDVGQVAGHYWHWFSIGNLIIIPLKNWRKMQFLHLLWH